MNKSEKIIINGKLTPIAIYKDIICVPYKKPSEKYLRGGPIYPDWDDTFGRFYRGIRNVIHLMDEYPEFEEPVDIIDEPVGWGGVIENIFGHFVAETCVSRVIPLVADFPDIKILLGIKPGVQISNWHYEILEYFGINREQIIFLDKPIMVKELYVAPQIEILNYGINDLANKEKYFEFLENLSSKKLVKRKEKLKAFVSRLFFPNKILGEKFLLDVFSKNGFQIVFPERLSIKEQLEIYYNSELIVFSEGSAIHGLHLLGKLDTKVVILNRRKYYTLGHKHLPIRVKDYKVIDCVLNDNTNIINPKYTYQMPAVLDIKCLNEKFNMLGINLDCRVLLKNYYFNVISDIIEYSLLHKYNENQIFHEFLLSFLSQLEDLDRESFIFLQEALKNIEKFYEKFILSRYKDGLEGKA